MRRFLLAAIILGAASSGHAADLPEFPALRGSLPPGLSTTSRNWDGWYVGGQLSYSAEASDFSKSIVGLSNFIFRDSVLQQPTSQFGLLAKTTTQGTGFGGFVGRNFQWEDLVFGLEPNYNPPTAAPHPRTHQAPCRSAILPGRATRPAGTRHMA